MGTQPGVMIYFDLNPIIKELSTEQAGILFFSILEYAEHGVLPKFGDDPMLRIAWASVRPKIDRDTEVYRTKCEKNAYNQYKRWQQDKNLDALPFEEWKKVRLNAPEYDGIGNIPTTTTTPTTTTKSTSPTNTTAIAKTKTAQTVFVPGPEEIDSIKKLREQRDRARQEDK